MDSKRELQATAEEAQQWLDQNRRIVVRIKNPLTCPHVQCRVGILDVLHAHTTRATGHVWAATHFNNQTIETKAGGNRTPWLSNLFPAFRQGHTWSTHTNTPTMNIPWEGHTYDNVETPYQWAKAHFYETHLRDPDLVTAN